MIDDIRKPVAPLTIRQFLTSFHPIHHRFGVRRVIQIAQRRDQVGSHRLVFQAIRGCCFSADLDTPKWIVPREIRDPRDAFVSLFIQLTRRTKETPEELKQKSASELLRDPAFGIESMVAVMNSWLAEWSGRPDFLLLRYETMRESPAPGFRELLHLLGENPVNEGAFAHALEFSDFGHMKKLESTGAFDSKILRAGDMRDPESFKVRRGKIGGFADYLSPNDQEYAASALETLDPRFGYTSPPSEVRGPDAS